MADVRSLGPVDLIPVIEIRLSATGPLPSPDTPDERDAYIRAMFHSRGFEGLQPVRPGSLLVAISSLSDASLDLALKEHTEQEDETGVTHDPEQWGAFSGGFVLSENGEQLIDPMCCGDLENLEGWKEAAQSSASEWKMLWVGHPWLEVRRQGDRLLLSDYHEDGPILERWSVDPSHLLSAVRKAESSLEQFALRVENSLRRVAPELTEARSLARLAAGFGRDSS